MPLVFLIHFIYGRLICYICSKMFLGIWLKSFLVLCKELICQGGEFFSDLHLFFVFEFPCRFIHLRPIPHPLKRKKPQLLARALDFPNYRVQLVTCFFTVLQETLYGYVSNNFIILPRPEPASLWLPGQSRTPLPDPRQEF